ncbi:hypothetical protein DIPPA_09991 [Diplonema papillatum]|nr:hypothetical protein DIPPA_09991 [Diplonema papillatum]
MWTMAETTNDQRPRYPPILLPRVTTTLTTLRAQRISSLNDEGHPVTLKPRSFKRTSTLKQSKADKGKYTVVFDLDETLIYAREGPLYARPGLDELFTLCKDSVEALVWTAGLRAYAQAIIKNIDKLGAVKYCVYRHAKWFTGQAGYRKDLGVLGRDLERTIIIENTPDCIRGYQQNGILVTDYEGGEMPDFTIPALAEFIRKLIDSGLTVPQYITSSPMLVRAPVQTDTGDFIQCYTLNINTWKPEGWSRTNRDLQR